MIDSTSEILWPLAQAAGHIPPRRRGRKAHASTIYRWATVGCRGVVLETLQVGGTRCTSAEALQRFFEALTIGASPTTASGATSAATRTASRRLRDSEEAARSLEKSGA